jgi:hypothetical protein
MNSMTVIGVLDIIKTEKLWKVGNNYEERIFLFIFYAIKVSSSLGGVR